MQVLILAMTKMLSGICAAGFTTEPDPISGLKWVRPVKEGDTLLLGDMTTTENEVLCCCDVAEICFKATRPDPPHVEDWVCDFVYNRPRRLRRLDGDRRAAFFPRYLDKKPEDVLVEQSRSLCLVQPNRVGAYFCLDSYSTKYRARVDVELGDTHLPRLPVTDIKWRALGRSWLNGGGELALSHDALRERLGIKDVYLALGLSRGYQGKLWPLVVGVHLVPDYIVEINYGRL